MRPILLCCLLLSSCCATHAQEVKLVHESVTVLTGIESPRIVGDMIVVGEKSKVKQSPAVFVTLVAPVGAQMVFIDFERPNWDIVDPPQIEANTWVLSEPGQYRITALVSVDGKFLRDRIVLEVQGARPPPVDPEDPVESPPTTGFADVAQVVKQALTQLSDAATAAAIKRNVTAALPKIQSSVDLTTAQVVAVAAIEDALRERKGDSLKRDWLNLFRRPLNAKMTEAAAAGRIPTPKEYAQAMAAIAEAL